MFDGSQVCFVSFPLLTREKPGLLLTVDGAAVSAGALTAETEAVPGVASRSVSRGISSTSSLWITSLYAPSSEGRCRARISCLMEGVQSSTLRVVEAPCRRRWMAAAAGTGMAVCLSLAQTRQ